MAIFSLYQTTNTKTARIYIGVHKETKWPKIDGYLGSGTLLKESIKKHGRDQFTRRVLVVSDNQQYVYALEAKLVTAEFMNSQDNYNVHVGGHGSYLHSDETKKTLSEMLQGNTRRKGTNTSEAGRQRMRDAKMGKKNHNCGIPRTPETRKRMSEAQRGIKSHCYGKVYTQEERNTRSVKMKAVWAERKQLKAQEII